MLTKNCLSALLLSSLILTAPAFAEDKPSAKNEADHTELRALKDLCVKAMNDNKLELLNDQIDAEHFTVITVSNKKFTDFDKFKAHWDSLFSGDKALIKKVVMKPTPDALTEFLAPGVGICHGISEDTYTFADGDVRTMKIRWTCVVRKVKGKWKLTKIHFSADVLENPVLEGVKGKIYQAGGAGAGAGLLVGLILLFMLRKKSND
ncbi:MAG: hypothetical protein P1V97_01415 [Planctomycetota bacterium]|nr:hypothetical protein [Planctomycetota bacterium]